MTVETGVPGGGVKRDPRKARYFFWWANPTDLERHLANDADACFAALRAGIDHHPTAVSGDADEHL